MARAVYVLWVGELTYVGPPNGPAWRAFARWVKGKADSALVYFREGAAESVVGANLAAAGKAVPFPDPQARLAGLRFEFSADSMEAFLLRVRCDPERGVTHLFCMSGDELVAEMEVDDGDNFVVLHVSERDAAELALLLSDPLANVEYCTSASAELGLIVGQGESWLAVGAKGPVREG